jgi:hypothetical protein
MEDMRIADKRIFFGISPHINYYHSYRGDSVGSGGFGHDVRLMATILSQIEAIEAEGLCGGTVRVSWDYADLFWSVQLQREYQPAVLSKVIERCRAGKDEVVIGSWGNVGQPWLDAEEFRTQHAWTLENSMGIGLKQLFPGRVAPYARTQEMMFTQGMIEEYRRLGVEGLSVYYSAIPFDNSRPFLKPRLDWNQRHGLVELKSTVSDASMLMIPTYGFGDALDHLSIKSWFQELRRRQETGAIRGHALVFLNFDMDAEMWIGVPVPRLLRWMPNTRGLRELAEAVDALEYVEFANLIDTIPKLVSSGHVYGETTLKPDVADGNFNGYHNWAQKRSNTELWTIGQRARYLKCVADTLSDSSPPETRERVDSLLRNGDDASDTYLRNKLLFASTTHFGMAMPLNHPHREMTAALHAWTHYRAAQRAAAAALDEVRQGILAPARTPGDPPRVLVSPVVNRGMTELETKPVHAPVLARIPVSQQMAPERPDQAAALFVMPVIPDTGERIPAVIYPPQAGLPRTLEMVVPAECFAESPRLLGILARGEDSAPAAGSRQLEASARALRNEAIAVGIDSDGQINSFSWNGLELGCPRFLESCVSYGKSREKARRVTSAVNRVEVLRDGGDGVSAAVRLAGELEIGAGLVARSTMILTAYAQIPALLARVELVLPKTEGTATSAMEASSVQTLYDASWQEVMPCEVKPALVGDGRPLRIWKHNFLGRVTCFDLDLREVDPENADVDCLSSAISDGWTAVSDGARGLLVGFNALAAANFAYAPLKVRDRGFGDVSRRGQQLRLNPFGTYWGRMLHYWHDGTGHAQQTVTQLSTTFRSTAPSFNGRSLSCELILVPYEGDMPPVEAQSLANHFAFPPLVLLDEGGVGQPNRGDWHSSYAPFAQASTDWFARFELEHAERPYLDWVRAVNDSPEKYGPEMPELAPAKLRFRTLLRAAIDGIRGR